MALSAGTRLGPYEIVAPLGAGGMGEVHRARDTRLERDVAIKVLPQQRADDPSALARFRREAQAIAALQHPNILALYDVGVERATTFAVMELLECETLRARISDSPLPWRRAVAIGVEIAEGLAAAHAKGVIHRDLKPENVFLTTDGRVKISLLFAVRDCLRARAVLHVELLALRHQIHVLTRSRPARLH